jgi:hypothetical protein
LQDSRAVLLRPLACHLGNFFCEKDEGRKIPGNYFNNLKDIITIMQIKLIPGNHFNNLKDIITELKLADTW